MARQFDDLRATELFCPRCRMARPVRERLLLVLPHGDLMEYRCQACGESCGTREVRAPPPGMATPPARRTAPASRRPPFPLP